MVTGDLLREWKGWDGNVNSSSVKAAPGVYFYVIRAYGWDNVLYNGKAVQRIRLSVQVTVQRRNGAMAQRGIKNHLLSKCITIISIIFLFLLCAFVPLSHCSFSPLCRCAIVPLRRYFHTPIMAPIIVRLTTLYIELIRKWANVLDSNR